MELNEQAGIKSRVWNKIQGLELDVRVGIKFASWNKM
jgi:hypothetical protein